ncbi:MAG: hypothetical protein ACLTVY_06280 [Faecalibacterium sp.]
MNGRNKYWREARWDKNQPARLAHIKEKRSKKHDEGRTGNVSADSVLEAAGPVPAAAASRDQEVAEHGGIG